MNSRHSRKRMLRPRAVLGSKLHLICKLSLFAGERRLILGEASTSPWPAAQVGSQRSPRAMRPQLA
jgi:hypothetical protein